MLGAPTLSVQSDARVAQAQQMLNALGYGPLAVDGIFGDQTRAALGRALGVSIQAVDDQTLSLLDQKLKAGVKAPVTPRVAGPINSGLVNEPLWKKPLFIGIGVAAVLGVLFFFTKNETKVLSGTSEGDARPKGIGPHAKPVGKTRRKCGKTPSWDDGEALEES